jgi:hypothetical protein
VLLGRCYAPREQQLQTDNKTVKTPSNSSSYTTQVAPYPFISSSTPFKAYQISVNKRMTEW